MQLHLSGSSIESLSFSGLSRLLAYDAEKDARKIQEEVHQLQVNYEEAQEDIIDKIRKNKRDFDQRVRNKFLLLFDGT